MQGGPQKTVVKFVQQADGSWKPVRVPAGEAQAAKAKPVAKPAKAEATDEWERAPPKPAAKFAAPAGKKLSGLLGLAKKKEVAAEDWEFQAALPEISTPAEAKKARAAKAAVEAAAKEAEEVAARGFVLDQYVKCRDKGGKWVNGTVTCLSPLMAQPDGGIKPFAWDEVVAIYEEECEFELDQRVRCRDKGGEWFNGTVTCTSPLQVQPDGGIMGFAYDEVVSKEAGAAAEKAKKKKSKAADWGEDEGWAEGGWDEWAGEEAPKAKKKKKMDEWGEWADEDWAAEPCEPPAKKAKKVVIKVRDANDFALVYGNAENAEDDEEFPKKKTASGGKGFLKGAKGGGKGVNPDQTYSGVVKLRHPLTGDLLVHCEPVTQAFGSPACIPYEDNPVGARVGSIVIFKVEVSDEGAPLAVDVRINGFDDEVEGAELLEPDEEDEEEELPKGKKGKAKGSKGKDKGKDIGKHKGSVKGSSKDWSKGKDKDAKGSSKDWSTGKDKSAKGSSKDWGKGKGKGSAKIGKGSSDWSDW